MRLYLLLILVLAFISAPAQVDTASTDPSENEAPTFFSGNEKIEPGQWKKTSIVNRNRKTTTLYALMNDEERMYPDHVLADLDDDGKKELILSRFTGGAHCCDEILVFRNTGPGRYQHAARLFGGHTIINDKKQFVFTFYEHYGYFFSCYACGLSDTSDTAPIDVKAITLRYKGGKMIAVPGDPELKSVINDNLGKLSEMPYEKLDPELSMDNGLRKEFAMNLAVYFFSFGKNLAGTKELFNRYYKFPDAVTVWNAFSKQLREMRSESDL